MRTFHTGRVAICGAPPYTSRGFKYLHRVNCKNCLRRAARARYDAKGIAVECVAHQDCLDHPELGLECAASRAA